MELLDRYLHAVKFWLPKAQQDDIIKELSDNILSQMEDKESELGRPLNEAEQSAILKQRAERGRRQALAQRTHHAACDKNKFHFNASNTFPPDRKSVV